MAASHSGRMAIEAVNEEGAGSRAANPAATEGPWPAILSLVEDTSWERIQRATSSGGGGGGPLTPQAASMLCAKQ